MISEKQTTYDAIIIGSGFGGAMTAHVLVNKGMKVLMLERGDWVRRGTHNWDIDGSVDLTPHYSEEIPYKILAGGNKPVMGAYACVGGPSIFYGAVSLRFREADFSPTDEITGMSGANWPVKYHEMEPYYSKAEQILHVAGIAGIDPTEPARSTDYTQKLNGISDTSKMIAEAARKMKLKPFRLPLAINYSKNHNRKECASCTTCDTFACAISAKNDLATVVLPELLEKGLELKTNTIATRLIAENGRISGVECFDKNAKKKVTYVGKTIVLSAGALASPHLLLASKLGSLNPAGKFIGHHLMRHCNAIAFGFFPQKPNPKNEFHKQIGIHDFYFGHPGITNPKGKLGTIQQLQTPPVGLVHSMVPPPFGKLIGLGVPHLTGLLVMAEDQPVFENHVAVNFDVIDKFGLPQLTVTHHHTKRDYAARDVLLKKASEILKKAGAKFCYLHKIKTFSHAVGTVRMGGNSQTDPLDENCGFRGLENLFVVDGSFMPTSSGLNPSLTISANALRVGETIAQNGVK